MPVSQISICNSALIELGADPISSITQDTKSARLLNAIYTQVRDEVLRAHPWNFAIKRASISANANTPENDYEFEFDLPSDCLRVLAVWKYKESSDDIDYTCEDSNLLANENALEMRYVYRHEDESSYDAAFAEAFALRLASKICYGLTQSSTLAEQIFAKYKDFMKMARSYDGTEGRAPELIADVLIKARY